MPRSASRAVRALLIVTGLVAPAAAPASPIKRPDKWPPTVAITAAPSASTTATTATFSFTGTDNVGVKGYECALDGGAPSPCASGIAYSGLRVASHEFRVRALDAAGNVSAAASHVWAVVAAASDTTAPTVTLTAPANGTTISGSTSLTATASDDAAVHHVTFRVDGVAIGSDWTSPYELSWGSTAVADGSHSVSVRAADTAGNVSVDSVVTVAVANSDEPSTGAYCGTRAVGSAVMTDDIATLMRRSHPAERIPANAGPNAIRPSQLQIAAFRAAADGSGWMGSAYNDKVTGNATGTTDELISWAACKWGVDEDVLRAVAVQESDWRQSATGDLCSGVFTSWGITQVKAPDLATGCRNGWRGVWPMNRDSTPFNLDFYGSRMRECYDGKVNWWPYPAGDLWGCIGWWFSGAWHSAAGDQYAASVKAHLSNRHWESYR
jgi:hypothetical protein